MDIEIFITLGYGDRNWQLYTHFKHNLLNYVSLFSVCNVEYLFQVSTIQNFNSSSLMKWQDKLVSGLS
jgi:hypothetical protein